MSSKPLVSIIMPAYNVEKTIKESIESVINQTYTNWELNIINDGSTDKTLEVINFFKDDRIVLIEQKNLGVANARNNGLKHSKGELVAFLDSDDLWCKEKLETQLKFMQKNELQFSYTQSYSFSSDSKNVQEAFKFVNLGFKDKEEILIYDFIPTLTVLVDTTGEDVSVGRTEYDSPEIDNIVHIQGRAEKGTFVNVKIESVNEYELIGTIV